MNVPLTPLEFRLRAVQLFGAKIGIVDGARRFTYREYDDRVNRLAGALRALGTAPGDVVSYLSFNSHQLLEGYYGVLQAGAILNPVNIRLTPQEIGYVLGHSGTRTLIFHAEFLPLVEQIRPALASVAHYVICEPRETPAWARDYEALLAGSAPLAPDLDAIDEHAVAELFYTSGTTGQPKGVASTHRTLFLHGLATIPALGVSDADVALHVVPLFHVNGWGTPHTVTAVGGRHVMLRRFDPAELMRLVQQERVTKLLGVPAILNAVLNHPRFGEFDLSSLNVVVLGGAPSPPALIRAIEDRMGCPAIVGYGLTETSPVISLSWPKAHLADSRENRLAAQAKTGLPIVGARVRVVDPEGRDVPRDGVTVGEIITRSNMVMEGYYKDSKATAAAIRGGWFHTGDMAVIDEEGYLLIVDRKKDIIISGGENISSVEIEAAVAGHPAVLECAVVAVPDDAWGEVPLATVVLKPGEVLTTDDLTAYLRGHLAHFKMPRRIEFRPQLPRGGTGKVLKSQLRAPHWAGRERQVN